MGLSGRQAGQTRYNPASRPLRLPPPMFQPIAVAIGLRYTRAKRKNHFISFISVVSILGMTLGITALITVLSVMNGFQEELRSRILSLTAHVTVSRFGEPVMDWQEQVERLEAMDGVVAAAPFTQGEAMLSQGRLVSGALLQGVDPVLERDVSAIAGMVRAPATLDDLQPGSFNIVLGSVLADKLGVGVGDSVTVITPQANSTPTGLVPRLKRFKVSGLFHADEYRYDSGVALANLDDIRVLYRQPEGSAQGMHLRVEELFAAPRIADGIAVELGREGFWVRDWTEEHANFFRAVQIEKTAMFVILTLIVAVAAFNLVSTLVMVVTDKQSDIAILRTLGMTPGGIMVVFMVQGLTIGLLGTLLGIVGGSLLAANVGSVVGWIESLFGIKFLAPDVYLISDLPSKVELADVTTVGLVAFVMAAVATVYPARRAAATAPAEALRYE